jgi:hypothetical protein
MRLNALIPLLAILPAAWSEDGIIAPLPVYASHTIGLQKTYVLFPSHTDGTDRGATLADGRLVPLQLRDKYRDMDAFFRKMSYGKAGIEFIEPRINILMEKTKAYYDEGKKYREHIDDAFALGKSRNLFDAVKDAAGNLPSADRLWVNFITSLGSTGRGELGGQRFWINSIGGRGYLIHEFSHTMGADHVNAPHDIGGYLYAPVKRAFHWLTPGDPQGFASRGLQVGVHQLQLAAEDDGTAQPGALRTAVFGPYSISFMSKPKSGDPGIYLWKGTTGDDDGSIDTTPSGTGHQLTPGLSYTWTDTQGRTHLLDNVAAVSVAAGKPPAMDVRWTINHPPTGSKAYRVLNAPTVITAVGATATVTADATGTIDANGNPEVMTWRLRKAGETVFSVTGTGPTATYTLPPGRNFFYTTTPTGTILSSMSVLVVPGTIGQKPVAAAGADIIVTDTDGDGVADVTCNGSASSDPDGIPRVAGEAAVAGSGRQRDAAAACRCTPGGTAGHRQPGQPQRG